MSSGIEERDTKGNWKINLLESNCAVLCDQFVYFLCSIPLESIENSAVGDAPKNIWQQLSGAIGGAITSAVNFIKNAVIAVANFINYAKEVIENAAMQVFNTAVSTVKSAVAVVKNIYDTLREEILKSIVKSIKSIMHSMYSFALKNINVFMKEFVKQKLFLNVAINSKDFSFTGILKDIQRFVKGFPSFIGAAWDIAPYIAQFDMTYLYMGSLLISLPGIIQPADFSVVWKDGFNSLHIKPESNSPSITKRQAWGIAMMMLASLLFPTGFSSKVGGAVGAIVSGGVTISISIEGLVLEFIASGLTIYGALIICGKAPTPDEVWNQFFGGD